MSKYPPASGFFSSPQPAKQATTIKAAKTTDKILRIFIPKSSFKKLHKNVRIENNVFEDCNEGYIDVTATDGVKVSQNTFIPHDGIKDGKIITTYCTNVEIEQ